MIPTRVPSTVGSATQRATAQVPPAPSHLCTSLIKFGRPSNQALVVSGRGRSSHVARAGRRGSNSPSARSSPPKAPAPPLTAEEEEIRVQMARAMNATILRFHVPEYKTSPGNWLAIVGSLDELGEWSVHEGARMKWLPGHEWVADVILPEHYSGTFEYKLVMMNDKGLCVWEPGTNRRLAVAGRTSNDQPHIDISLQWGIREAEVLSDSEVEFPTAMLEAMYERAEQAVRAMPGINAATVLLQAQQQLSQSKTVHKEQVTSLRAQLVSLQQSSQRETNRVQTRMRELERTMETMQARLEQERKISEKHIELLKAQISEKKAEQAEAAARAEAEAEAAARAEEEAAAAAQEAQRVARSAPHISAYEPHVMALLPNYSGLTLERLHNMLAQAVFQPRYTRDTPDDLATLLADLVANNKIIADGAIYRYRSRDGSIVGSRSRARTPRAVSAVPAVSETVSATATETATVVDPRFLTLEPKVLACLDSASSGAGVPLERLVGLLRSVAPRAGCGLDQLALLMNHLEQQGKVVNDGGLYRHAKALQPVVDTVEMAPAPRVLQPVVDTVEMAPVQRTGTPVSPRRAHAPVPKRRATAPPPPEPEAPFYGRTFTDGEQEYQAPQGSVAGGPPGSAGHGSLAPGGSIMPAFDSTGAHPTLDAVSQFERPVLEVLSRNGGLSMERLHMIMCSTYPKFANSSIEELAAVLKNLTDQHKIHNIDGTIAFVRF